MEDQLARSRRLLELKGVPIEEEESKVDSQEILEQYQHKKDSEGKKEWDDFKAEWNAEGTLSRITTYKDGERFWRLDFVWDSNGRLITAARS